MSHKYQNTKRGQSPIYKPKLINHILDSDSDQSDSQYQEIDQHYFQRNINQIVQKNGNHQNQRKNVHQTMNEKTSFNSRPRNNSQIHYETLKLSEYQSDEPIPIQRNLKNQYKRVDQKDQIKSIFQYQSKSRFCNDSLDPVKSTNRSRIKQQDFNQKKTQSNNPDKCHQTQIQLYQKQIDQFQVQIQSLKRELKRSNDIIKTMTLKNNDLQKTIEMKNIQINQINSISNRQKQFSSKNNLYQNKVNEAIHQNYKKITKYMEIKITQLQEDITSIKNIKINPILLQKLNCFFQEITLINQITVSKVVCSQMLPLIKVQNHRTIKQCDKYQADRQSDIITPNKNCFRQTNNIYEKSNTPINLIKQNKSDFISKSASNVNAKIFNKTQFQIKKVNLRQNAHLNRFNDNQKSQISNKSVNEDYKKLQKSLQKLRQMQKQNTPNNHQNINNISNHFTSSKSQFQRSQYSIVGLDRSQVSNIDRSRSKRKKIFN